MPLLQQIRSLFARTFDVRGNSMEPTFADGSSVTLDPFAYASRLPQRRDVISLRAPSSERFELKRIIGLPGEEVSWLGGDLWINGEKLEEPYTQKAPAPPGDEKQLLKLGIGEYFVAGDNRLYSRDSRVYGPIHETEITAKVL